MNHLVVVTDARDAAGIENHEIINAEDYLSDQAKPDRARVVINLCRSFAYGSEGYYVSLLAGARGQRCLPAVETMTALAESYGCFRALQEAELAISGKAGSGSEIVEQLSCFGRCRDARFGALAERVYRIWPVPLLRLQLVLEEASWKVAGLELESVHELSPSERDLLRQVLDQDNVLPVRGRPSGARASIAVLVDAADPFSPSSPATIERLRDVAARRGVHVATLGLEEAWRLAEYDALFVRAHTGVTQPAFQLALRAEALGLPVIDDTRSTIRCTNKVFLEELLQREGLPTPRTLIVTAGTAWAALEQLGLPFVLKLPDGDFSAAVHRISSAREYEQRSGAMFEYSPLLIAQEWLPTDFDWRIGVLGGKLLFAARYYMAAGHWQIRTVEKGTERYGRVEAVPREQAPAEVVELALRAARLIGNGFYGVDLKQTDRGAFIIEINDNANLDTGYEDVADGERIYQDLVDYFVERIERGNGSGERTRIEEDLTRMREPIVATSGRDRFGLFDVMGIEIEYPIVDRDLNVVSLVQPAFRLITGGEQSDIELGAVTFSNEFADHVLEVKTTRPLASLTEAERVLHEGLQRFAAVLRDEYDARLLPTGMHPWFDPRRGRLWSGEYNEIYRTYERLFDVRTHGWMNVQAVHLNLPFGNEQETVALYNACVLLLPYLPALAASSPVRLGELADDVDGRLAWLLRHQDRVPESIGHGLPEFIHSFDDYRTRILEPMYQALDRLPGTGLIRGEFFNTRAAILRFSRHALEIRALDTQECVRIDLAIAAFTKCALASLTRAILDGRLPLPDWQPLLADMRACVRQGSTARVSAPHLGLGEASARDALRALLRHAREGTTAEERSYLDLVELMIESGSLAERIRAALEPALDAPPATLKHELRRIYVELADSLELNQPWVGRRLGQPSAPPAATPKPVLTRSS